MRLIFCAEYSDDPVINGIVCGFVISMIIYYTARAVFSFWFLNK